jgi:hypothetical protein
VESVPFKDAAQRRLYMRGYMRDRYWQDKAFAWEKQLREERRLMRKALKRVALAEGWVSQHPDEKIDERLLSLAFQWNQVAEEEEKKAKNSKRVGVWVRQGFESVPPDVSLNKKFHLQFLA